MGLAGTHQLSSTTTFSFDKDDCFAFKAMCL